MIVLTHGTAGYILETLNEVMKGEALMCWPAVYLMNTIDSSVFQYAWTFPLKSS